MQQPIYRFTDDAVSLARFLLSDEDRYVNNADIHLSSGWGV